MIILSIIKIILIILSLLAFLLTIIGTPVGIVLLVIYLSNKKKRTVRLGRLILISLSGMPLLGVIFILWSLISLTSVFFGFNVTGFQNENGLMMIK